MRVVILRGKVSIEDFLLGGECTLRDVVRIWCIFFFSFYLRYIFLVHGSCDHYWHTLYLYSLYSDVCFFFIYLTCVVSFLSLHTCFLLLICNLLFLFLFLNEFCLKCFRNTSCQSLLAINSLFAKFLRVCVRIDFIVFNKWIWVEWFMTSLISHLFVVVLSWIAKGGDC